VGTQKKFLLASLAKFAPPTFKTVVPSLFICNEAETGQTRMASVKTNEMKTSETAVEGGMIYIILIVPEYQ